MRRQAGGGAFVIGDRAQIFAGPAIRFVRALFGAAQIDQKTHAERFQPRNVGLAGAVKRRRTIEQAARHAAAIGSLIAAEIAEIRHAVEIDQPVMHGARF